LHVKLLLDLNADEEVFKRCSGDNVLRIKKTVSYDVVINRASFPLNLYDGSVTNIKLPDELFSDSILLVEGKGLYCTRSKRNALQIKLSY